MFCRAECGEGQAGSVWQSGQFCGVACLVNVHRVQWNVMWRGVAGRLAVCDKDRQQYVVWVQGCGSYRTAGSRSLLDKPLVSHV
jgi:hypothetical protein